MKHAFTGALVAGAVCIAAATIHGQKSKAFACDADNGGLKQQDAAAMLVTLDRFDAIFDVLTDDVALGLYPNPTTGNLTLRGRTTSSCALHVEVLNAFGQILVQRSFATSPGLIRTTIDLSALADGAYIARVTCNDTQLVERVIRVSE